MHSSLSTQVYILNFNEEFGECPHKTCELGTSNKFKTAGLDCCKALYREYSLRNTSHDFKTPSNSVC